MPLIDPGSPLEQLRNDWAAGTRELGRHFANRVDVKGRGLGVIHATVKVRIFARSATSVRTAQSNTQNTRHGFKCIDEARIMSCCLDDSVLGDANESLRYQIQ